MRRFNSQARLVPSGQQTVVIKVGTSSLLRDEKHSLNLSSLAGICETVRDLKDQGYNVVIVSSGAVGVGCQRLGLEVRPSGLAQKQALAAVGQQHLMRYYDDFFSALGLNSAQVLLTLDNLANRSQYVNARNTFMELLRYGAIPVVNENDTVAVEQLRFGDNDTLSAQVATLIQADWLFLLTDVDCLYTANPHTDPSATPIHEVHDLTKLQVDTSTAGTQWGTGGMATKLTAARIATAAGCRMGICNSSDPRNILAMIKGQQRGTVFHPISHPVRGRKRWLLSVPVKGELWLDEGAARAVKDRRTSLFSAGIVKVAGDFHAQDSVRLCDRQGREFGRGLINYTQEEVAKVKGMASRLLQETLGYGGPEEVIHRANICLMVEGDEEGDGGVPCFSEHGLGAVPPDQDPSASASLTPPQPPVQQQPLPPPSPGTGGGAAHVTCTAGRRAQAPVQEADVATDGAQLAIGRERSLREGGVEAKGLGVGGVDDVAARLAVLRDRGGEGEELCVCGGGGGIPEEGKDRSAHPGATRQDHARTGDDVDWRAELAHAVIAERQAATAAVTSGVLPGEAGDRGRVEDITEEGWMP